MKVKLRVHYGPNKPGDTVDIKAAEAEHLIATRQAKTVEDSELDPEQHEIPPTDPEGGEAESEPAVPADKEPADVPEPEVKKKGSGRKGAADDES